MVARTGATAETAQKFQIGISMKIPGVTRRASLRQGRTAGPGQKQGATHKHTHSYKHTYFLINSTANNMHILHLYKLPPNNDRGMVIIMCE